MNTYLVTWNPQNSTWANLPEQAQQTRHGVSVVEQWSCGNTKRIAKGERLFLLKQGPEQPKGIMASGVVSSEGVFEGPHWDAEKAEHGEFAHYINGHWEIILNPDCEALLPVSAFQYGELPFFHWNTQKSGILIPDAVAEVMEQIWSRHVEAVRGTGTAYSVSSSDPEESEFPEGRVLYRVHRFHERNSDLVAKVKSIAKNSGHLECSVCSFDFFKTYGEVGKDFIECHHTIPVSKLSEGMTTKIADMVLVCSNCHRMLHRRRPWLEVGQLKELLGTDM